MKYVSFDKAKNKWRVSTPVRNGSKAIQKRFAKKKDAEKWIINFLKENPVKKIERIKLRNGKIIKCVHCKKKIYRSAAQYKKFTSCCSRSSAAIFARGLNGKTEGNLSCVDG